MWAECGRNISICYQSLKSETIDKKPFWRSEMSAVPREGGALRDPYCSLIPESTGHKDKPYDKCREPFAVLSPIDDFARNHRAE